MDDPREKSETSISPRREIRLALGVRTRIGTEHPRIYVLQERLAAIEHRVEHFRHYLELMQQRSLRQEKPDCFIIFEADTQLEHPHRTNMGYWIQFAFMKETFYMDLPNTTLTPVESQRLIRERNGFEFYLKNLKKRPAKYEQTYNPVQRYYQYSEISQAAADIAFLFFDLWKLPINVWIKVKSSSFKDARDWERGDFYIG
jgi:hypothetical protein